jgi:hypothetical protein
MTYEQMRSIDINAIDRSAVKDVRDIHIDIGLPVPHRMKSYEQQMGNVYFMKVGTVIVKICHVDTQTSINDCWERVLKTS